MILSLSQLSCTIGDKKRSIWTRGDDEIVENATLQRIGLAWTHGLNYVSQCVATLPFYTCLCRWYDVSKVFLCKQPNWSANVSSGIKLLQDHPDSAVCGQSFVRYTLLLYSLFLNMRVIFSQSSAGLVLSNFISKPMHCHRPRKSCRNLTAAMYQSRAAMLQWRPMRCQVSGEFQLDWFLRKS